MGEAPSKGPGGSLKDLIATAERTILDNSSQSLPAFPGIEREEVGPLLAGLAMVNEDKSDPHDIFVACSLLGDLTGFPKTKTEIFSVYIERLRELRLAAAARAKASAALGKSVRSPVPPTIALPPRRTTPPAPARVTTASPVPATAVIPGRPTPPSRPSVPSPAPDVPIATRRASPSPDGRTQLGRPMVQLRGGGTVPLPSPGPTRMSVPSVSSISTETPVPPTIAPIIVDTTPSLDAIRRFRAPEPSGTGVIRVDLPPAKPKHVAPVHAGATRHSGPQRITGQAGRHLDRDETPPAIVNRTTSDTAIADDRASLRDTIMRAKRPGES